MAYSACLLRVDGVRVVPCSVGAVGAPRHRRDVCESPRAGDEREYGTRGEGKKNTKNNAGNNSAASSTRCATARRRYSKAPTH